MGRQRDSRDALVQVTVAEGAWVGETCMARKGVESDSLKESLEEAAQSSKKEKYLRQCTPMRKVPQRGDT